MASLVLSLATTDGSTLRGKVVDNVELYSVYDFMSKACCYTHSGTTKEFSRLIADGSEHKDEVTRMCRYIQFPGRGQRLTPVMTLAGLQRLLLILGGKVAAEFRRIVDETFRRVMGGERAVPIPAPPVHLAEPRHQHEPHVAPVRARPRRPRPHPEDGVGLELPPHAQAGPARRAR